MELEKNGAQSDACDLQHAAIWFREILKNFSDCGAQVHLVIIFVGVGFQMTQHVIEGEDGGEEAEQNVDWAVEGCVHAFVGIRAQRVGREEKAERADALEDGGVVTLDVLGEDLGGPKVVDESLRCCLRIFNFLKLLQHVLITKVVRQLAHDGSPARQARDRWSGLSSSSRLISEFRAESSDLPVPKFLIVDQVFDEELGGVSGAWDGDAAKSLAGDRVGQQRVGGVVADERDDLDVVLAALLVHLDDFPRHGRAGHVKLAILLVVVVFMAVDVRDSPWNHADAFDAEHEGESSFVPEGALVVREVRVNRPISGGLGDVREELAAHIFGESEHVRLDGVGGLKRMAEGPLRGLVLGVGVREVQRGEADAHLEFRAGDFEAVVEVVIQGGFDVGSVAKFSVEPRNISNEIIVCVRGWKMRFVFSFEVVDAVFVQAVEVLDFVERSCFVLQNVIVDEPVKVADQANVECVVSDFAHSKRVLHLGRIARDVKERVLLLLLLLLLLLFAL